MHANGHAPDDVFASQVSCGTRPLPSSSPRPHSHLASTAAASSATAAGATPTSRRSASVPRVIPVIGGGLRSPFTGEHWCSLQVAPACVCVCVCTPSLTHSPVCMRVITTPLFHSHVSIPHHCYIIRVCVCVCVSVSLSPLSLSLSLSLSLLDVQLVLVTCVQASLDSHSGRPPRGCLMHNWPITNVLELSVIPNVCLACLLLTWCSW